MTLARIIAIAVLIHMAFVSSRMTASLYALANHASTFTVGVIMALFALVPMLTGLRAGRWLDAVGPWRPTLAGTGLVLGGTLLPVLFPYATADVAPLLVSAAMVGTGQMLTMLSIQQVIGRVYEPMPLYVLGVLIYFAINYSLSLMSRRLEARFAYIRE